MTLNNLTNLYAEDEIMIKNIRFNSKLIIITILSFITYILANGVWCIPLLAWIYPVLFLWLVQSYPSSKMCFIIWGIYAFGFIIRFANVIGVDFWLCAVVAILIAVLYSLPYLFWQKSQKNFNATVIFAVGMVIVEYAISSIYPILGGLSDAYTQYKNSLLLQIVTVTGIYGISFIMYWTAAVVIWLWNKRNELCQIKRCLFIYFIVISLMLMYGVVMSQSIGTAENSMRIAGVTVPVSPLLNEDDDVYAVFYTNSFSDENMVNARRKLSEVADELFLKTEKEAQAGAKVVFWSELNEAILKSDEAELLQRASDTTKEQEIYLIVSLLVKTPYQDLKENKTIAFNPQGEQMAQHYKFGRSIGELCLKGDGMLQSFDTEYGRIASFICSDMAFSSKIRQFGKNNVDILIVPASDWKEMTGIAIKTAVVRGVENGCNVMRHTNKGISIVSDARGNILAMADYFKSDTKTLAAQTMTSGRFTVYSYIGDIFVYLCIVYLVGNFIYQIKKQKNVSISDTS
jgi:apolipoprotein N-acyltransferase